MKKTLFLAIGLALLFGAGNAFGDVTYTFKPSPVDLNDLDHTKAYYWNIDSNIQAQGGATMYQRLLSGESISSVTLTFDNISNYDSNANTLFINLFDNKITKTYNTQYYDGGSVTTFSDADNGMVDYFDSAHGSTFTFTMSGTLVDLTTFTNIPMTASDKIYTFTSSNPDEITALKNYALSDHYFALAIDPDCHYYNDGISLAVNFGGTTPQQAVPEPATMMLFGTGLVGLAGVARKRLKK